MNTYMVDFCFSNASIQSSGIESMVGCYVASSCPSISYLSPLLSPYILSSKCSFRFLVPLMFARPLSPVDPAEGTEAGAQAAEVGPLWRSPRRSAMARFLGTARPMVSACVGEAMTNLRIAGVWVAFSIAIGEFLCFIDLVHSLPRASVDALLDIVGLIFFLLQTYKIYATQ